RERRTIEPFEGQSARAHPVRDREARGALPGPQLLRLHAPVIGELLPQADRAARARVVAEHHLVLALEDVVPDEVRFDDLEPQLLAHLAHDAALRVLQRLEIAGHQGEEALRPPGVAREDDLALVLDERSDARDGISPLDEAASLDARAAHARGAVDVDERAL